VDTEEENENAADFLHPAETFTQVGLEGGGGDAGNGAEAEMKTREKPAMKTSEWSSTVMRTLVLGRASLSWPKESPVM
jgi:hypothetical protein